MTLRITELPIRRWTEDYNEFLDSMMKADDKAKEPFIMDKRAHNDDTSVHFEVILSEENMKATLVEGLEKKFKLTPTISTSNMHLFDSKGVIKKYDTPEQIIEDFYDLRIQFYEKRRKVLLDNLDLEHLKMDNKVRFILALVNGEIIVNRKRANLFLELHQKGFTPFPKKTKGIDAAVAGATVDAEESEDSPEMVKGGVKASDYDYLLSMAIGTLTLEKVPEICAERKKLEHELQELRSTSPRALWIKDLDAFEKKRDEHDEKDAEEEKVKKEIRAKSIAGAGVSRQAAKKSRKNNANKNSTASAPDADNIPEVGKPKPRGGHKKAAAQKATVVESDDDEDVLELKDRLAAYSLDSSPDQTTMETDSLAEEVVTNKVPAKKAPAKKAKKSTFTITEDDNDLDGDQMPTIVEDADDDEDFQMMGAAPKGKKGGSGRKPTNAKAKATVAANMRKRGGGAQGKQSLSQKLITEILKPIEITSPEKKVRKMRESPFNKKSGSVLGRVEGSIASSSGSLEAEMDEVRIARNRQKRENKAKVTYIERVRGRRGAACSRIG